MLSTTIRKGIKKNEKKLFLVKFYMEKRCFLILIRSVVSGEKS